MRKIKLIILSIILLSLGTIVFVACTKDNDREKTNDIAENITILSTKIIENGDQLKEKIELNDKIIFTDEDILALNKCKNINEWKIALQNGGIKNADEVILLLKNRINIQNTFVKSNEEFYKFDIEKELNWLMMILMMYLKKLKLLMKD